MRKEGVQLQHSFAGCVLGIFVPIVFAQLWLVSEFKVWHSLTHVITSGYGFHLIHMFHKICFDNVSQYFVAYTIGISYKKM